MGSFRESFPSFSEYFAEHEGSMLCGCDHGCNQWIKEQEGRLALSVRMLLKGSPNLDKMAAMPLKRVKNIWYWVQYQDNRRMNDKMRAEDVARFRARCLEVGLDNIQAALDKHSGDRKLAAADLGMKPYEIGLGYLKYGKGDDDDNSARTT